MIAAVYARKSTDQGGPDEGGASAHLAWLLDVTPKAAGSA